MSAESMLDTAVPVEEAIAIIEECQRIHRLWVDYQQGTPDWRDDVAADPEMIGVTGHHQDWIAKYDRVLAVLRGAA